MNHQSVLRTLLGSSEAPTSPLVSPPAPGWRSGIGTLIRRERTRFEVRSGPPRERITWPASPGHRRKYQTLRQALLGGYLWIELPSDSPVRLLYSTSEFVPTDALRLGSGGGIRQRGLWGGRPVLARFGEKGSPADPSWHFAALDRFHLEQIPEGVATGEIDGVCWTIEAFHAGQAPTILSVPQARQAADFLSRLPRGTPPADVTRRAAADLTTLLVDLGSLPRVVDAGLMNLPAVVTHGDFWSGNLLFDGNRLMGVIDWDSWSDRGIPGLDLLHLWAEDLRRDRGVSYGDLIEQRFWTEETVSGGVADYFGTLSLDWQSDIQLLLGAAWWMTAVAGAVRRNPSLGTDGSWMDRNAQRPAETFSVLLD